jgi:hypothetical protein
MKMSIVFAPALLGPALFALAPACSASPEDDVESLASAQTVAVGAFPPGQSFGLADAQRTDASRKMVAIYNAFGGHLVGAPAVSPNTAHGYVHPWPNATCLTQNFYNAQSPGESGALVYSVQSKRAYWLRGQVYKKFTFFTNNSRMGCPVADEVNEGNGCYSMTFEGANDDGNRTVRWCGGQDPSYCDFRRDFSGMETTTNGREGCVPIFLPPKRGSLQSCPAYAGPGPCSHHANRCAFDFANGGEVRAARGGRVEAQIGAPGCQNGCNDQACCNACMNSGNHVIIHHADGSQELYFHLATVAVPNGAHVGPNAVLGTAGRSGCAFGTHLHFEARKRGGAPWAPTECAQIGRMIQ